jgi:hypothetical protein
MTASFGITKKVLIKQVRARNFNLLMDIVLAVRSNKPAKVRQFLKITQNGKKKEEEKESMYVMHV